MIKMYYRKKTEGKAVDATSGGNQSEIKILYRYPVSVASLNAVVSKDSPQGMSVLMYVVQTVYIHTSTLPKITHSVC